MTAVTDGTAVARGVYWDDANGGQRLRVLSVGGTYWQPGMAEDGETDPDREHAHAIAAAAQAVMDAAGGGVGSGGLTIGREAGTPWQVYSEQTPDDYGRLAVELTAAELAEACTGRMPAAVRIRIKRALDANVPRPERYAGELPAVCKVSTRGRRSAAAAKPKPAPVARLRDAITRPNGQPYYPRTVGDRTDVDVVREAHANGLCVLAHGAPGTGKTAMLEAAFNRTGFEYLSGTGDTIVDDIVGGFVPEPGGSFRWVNGPLLRAMERGVPFIIDEISMIEPKLLTIVYAPMDGRGELPITQNELLGTVKAQPGFGVHGACNPDAPGSIMSEALTSRLVFQVEYGTDYALAQRLGAPAFVVDAARNLEAKRLTGETTYAPQMRELLAYVKVAKLFGDDMALANLVGCAPQVDRGIVAEIVSRSAGRPVEALRIGE